MRLVDGSEQLLGIKGRVSFMLMIAKMEINKIVLIRFLSLPLFYRCPFSDTIFLLVLLVLLDKHF